MPGKRVQFDDETWHALDLLARDRMQDFQDGKGQKLMWWLTYRRSGRASGVVRPLEDLQQEIPEHVGHAAGPTLVARRRITLAGQTEIRLAS